MSDAIEEAQRRSYDEDKDPVGSELEELIRSELILIDVSPARELPSSHLFKLAQHLNLLPAKGHPSVAATRDALKVASLCEAAIRYGPIADRHLGIPKGDLIDLIIPFDHGGHVQSVRSSDYYLRIL
jgi:hypothetical protein